MPVAPSSTRAMPSASPAERLYLTLDQGGHSSRARVFSANGAVIASAQLPVATHSPQPGWVEQDADELLASLRSVIAGVHAQLGTRVAQVRAAGLATQRSNSVCWDRRSGAALSPALSWQDRRAQQWLEQLTLDDAWLHARTGLRRSPHYGAGKLRWCLDHLPEVQQAAAERRLCCGPLAAYLLANLCNERPCAVDPANAARTLLWNLAAGDWDAELLKLFGIDRAILPNTVPTRHAHGTLAWGDAALPLRILTGDQSAALYAGGAPDADTLYLNIGTGAFLQRPVAGLPQTPPGLLASIVYADGARTDSVLEATVNGAGSALDWACERLGIADIETHLADWLRRDGEIPLFLNGVAGLGSPWWRAGFESRFVGTGEHGFWAQAVAVAESIVFLIAANLELMNNGAPVRRIRASGGLARLDALCQRLADVAGLPVLRSPETEATARGVAWLLADEEGSGWQDDAGDVFTPRADSEAVTRYRRWRAAMQTAVSV